MAWQDNVVAGRKRWDGGYNYQAMSMVNSSAIQQLQPDQLLNNLTVMYSIQDTQNNDWRTPVSQLKHRLDVVEDVLFHQKEVLTLEEASKYTGFSCSTLYKLTSAHKIPFYKPAGKVILFEKKELLEWIRSSRIEADRNNVISNN